MIHYSWSAPAPLPPSRWGTKRVNGPKKKSTHFLASSTINLGNVYKKYGYNKWKFLMQCMINKEQRVISIHCHTFRIVGEGWIDVDCWSQVEVIKGVTMDLEDIVKVRIKDVTETRLDIFQVVMFSVLHHSV